jgi:hypothetical protein
LYFRDLLAPVAIISQPLASLLKTPFKKYSVDHSKRVSASFWELSFDESVAARRSNSVIIISHTTKTKRYSVVAS